MSENDLKLPPKLLSQHLRCRARVMRQCGSRLAPEFEQAADCIDDLRLGNNPRVQWLEMLYMVNLAIQNVRSAGTGGAQLVRAMRHLTDLRQYIEDQIAPLDDC